MFEKYFIPSVLLVTIIGCISGADPNCDRSGVGAMKQIYHCCKHPDGHNEIAEKCAAATGFKLPSATEESFLDITIENAIKASCFSECVFNESKFINNGSIDMNSIREAIQNDSTDDQEYVKDMTNAFDQCHTASQERKVAVLRSSFVTQHLKDRCDPMPGVILSCAILKFFKNCPKSRWTDNQQCNDAQAFINSCEKKFG